MKSFETSSTTAGLSNLSKFALADALAQRLFFRISFMLGMTGQPSTVSGPMSCRVKLNKGWVGSSKRKESRSLHHCTSADGS